MRCKMGQNLLHKCQRCSAQEPCSILYQTNFTVIKNTTRNLYTLKLFPVSIYLQAYSTHNIGAVARKTYIYTKMDKKLEQ